MSSETWRITRACHYLPDCVGPQSRLEVHASFTSLPLGEPTAFFSSGVVCFLCVGGIFFLGTVDMFGMSNSLFEGSCPVLYRMFSSVLNSTH